MIGEIIETVKVVLVMLPIMYVIKVVCEYINRDDVTLTKKDLENLQRLMNEKRRR